MADTRLEPRISTALGELKDRLEEERRRIGAEIGAYPRPIAGCDAQFNHLLEERSRIGSALKAVATLLDAARLGGMDRHAAAALIALPELVDPDLATALRRAAGEVRSQR